MPSIEPCLPTGTVTGVDGQLFRVRIGSEDLHCALRGRLKKQRRRVSSLVVVGDEVSVRPTDPGAGAIEDLHPRRNTLARPGFAGIENVIAANVDQLAIVVSLAQPRFNPNLVDRFLLHAVRSDVPAVVVATKADMEAPERIDAALAPLRANGVAVVLTSTRTGQGLDELHARLAGGLTVLAGHSGVGKSSLVNALVPEAAVRTGATSVVDKGRHTTTASRCYDLPGGGLLVDTPGIRSLGVWETPDEDVAEVFPDIEELAAGCRFRDCRHGPEPGCAVRAAVERGDVDGRRLKSFHKVSARRR